MKSRHGAIIGLLLLATCSEEPAEQAPASSESTAKALGTIPPTEVASWQKVSSCSLPDGRFLQAVAFDESRRVLVMFGGMVTEPDTGNLAPSRETWEWSPQTGRWTNRTGTGPAPDPRSGAAMAFDSEHRKLVLFGGRAGSGFNLEDTWEWEPTSGKWTNVSAAGNHPSARSQHGMVFEKGTGKILLFGGGRSDTKSPDGTGILASLGDTWEYDPASSTWKQLTPASAPSARHDFGLVWDSAHGKAILFGGLQVDIAGAPGIPKQDTWEWQAASSTWTERTAAGTKPSQRYAHAMAFDGKRGKVLLLGGLDVSSGGSLSDLWELEPTSFAWTQRLTGAERDLPSPRMYASLVSDDVSGMLELVAGATAYGSSGSGGSYGTGGTPASGGSYAIGGMAGSAVAYDAGGFNGSGGSPGIGPIGPGYGANGSQDVWELDPTKPAFTDRSYPSDVPSPRASQAMAYYPDTGKTYLFGGYDSRSGQPLDDLWEWDSKVWTKVAAEARPPARGDAGLAYDPARKSLILFGGIDYAVGFPYGDTWEFGVTRKWTQLSPSRSPAGLSAHGMVTDMARKKILLYAGMGINYWSDSGFYKDPMNYDVWEWDGATTTWTDRTPPNTPLSPPGYTYPIMSYDEGRQRLFVFDPAYPGMASTNYWEWDSLTAGWTSTGIGDTLFMSSATGIAYDSVRRRQVLLGYLGQISDVAIQNTAEIDTRGPTLYVRDTAATPDAQAASLAFDRARGVVVLYGGWSPNGVSSLGDTWEYKVTNLGNGEGCTPAFAASCASGFCVDGVCCDVAACTGVCRSCSVPGSEGTCLLAPPGSEVPGSCADGKACDASGACRAKNGQTCAGPTECASGFCVDGVCCDSACTGNCMSCDQVGRAGRCTPHAAGSDPEGECGQGTGVCKSTCNGVGDCAYPQTNTTCGNCMLCDGSGECSINDFYCANTGGSGGYIPTGGSGGYVPTGGAGGYILTGGSGGRVPTGGGGGYVPTGGAGGRGGSTPIRGGSGGGSNPPPGGSGGTTAVVGGSGGYVPTGGSGGNSIPSSASPDGGLPATGGSTGGIPKDGGAGGAISGSGGATGGTPDAGAGSVSDLGSSTPADARGADADNSNLHKSGCSCELGASGVSGLGSTPPLLWVGAAILGLRRRRRR